ncbi:MAG: hypothetical protein AABY22_29440 [Nanoarchaeota archaeon]
MEKHLEDYMWNEISYVNDEKWDTEFHKFPRDVIREMLVNGWINSPKQAHATLNKWAAKGIYSYGCCLDLGWKVKKEGAIC